MVDFCEWCHRHICEECEGPGEDTINGWFCSGCIKDVDIKNDIQIKIILCERESKKYGKNV